MLQALVTERRALAGARHVDRCARTLITGPGRTFDAQVSLEAVSRRMRAEVVNNVVVTDKRGPLAEARECALSGAQTPTQLLASLPTYAEAKKLVDTLSDHRCPVEHTRIVGTGLHSVEYVTGRLTPWLPLQSDAASGAWFGLFVGFLLGLFSHGTNWFAVVIGAGIVGSVWGSGFGWVAQRLSHGRWDFNRIQRLEADRYAVFIDASPIEDAPRVWGPA